MTQLNNQARECDILPGLKYNSLISVSKLAAAGYTTIFDAMDGTVKVYNKEDMTLTSRGKPVLRGWQEANGLWRIPLTDQVGYNKHTAIHMYNNQYHQAIHNVSDLPSIEQSFRYQHACCGFPTKSTWLKAIRKGNFVGWPLLTVENVNKYFPESEETQLGHLSQLRQGLRFTKVKPQDIEEVDKSLTVGKKERDVYFKVYELKETIYTVIRQGNFLHVPAGEIATSW